MHFGHIQHRSPVADRELVRRVAVGHRVVAVHNEAAVVVGHTVAVAVDHAVAVVHTAVAVHMAAVVRNIAAAAHEAAVGMTFDHNHKVSVVHEGAASTEMMIAVVDAAHKVVVVAHMKGVGPGVVVHCLRAAPRRLAPWQQQLLAWMQVPLCFSCRSADYRKLVTVRLRRLSSSSSIAEMK